MVAVIRGTGAGDAPQLASNNMSNIATLVIATARSCRTRGGCRAGTRSNTTIAAQSPIGATNEAGRKTYAAYALLWECIVAAKRAGRRVFDMGGIPVPDARGLETLLRGIKEKAVDDNAFLSEAVRILDLFYSAYGRNKDEVAAAET